MRNGMRVVRKKPKDKYYVIPLIWVIKVAKFIKTENILGSDQVLLLWRNQLKSVAIGHTQFTSVAQSCPTLCDPMNHSTPGLSVHHQLPEFTQTHAHQVSDPTQPTHPLSSPSPPAPNPSQHQTLFQWVNSFAWGGQSTGVSALASFLPNNTQGWSPLEWTGWISLQSKGLSRVFSNTTV